MYNQHINRLSCLRHTGAGRAAEAWVWAFSFLCIGWPVSSSKNLQGRQRGRVACSTNMSLSAARGAAAKVVAFLHVRIALCVKTSCCFMLRAWAPRFVRYRLRACTMRPYPLSCLPSASLTAAETVHRTPRGGHLLREREMPQAMAAAWGLRCLHRK